MRFQAEQQARRSRTPAAHSASAQNDASPAGGFLLDSGATQHMHSSRAAYVEYSRLSAPVHITFGAGDTRPAVGIGSIYLLPTDGGHPVIMTDVLHVPELLRPLLSVSQLLKRGCKINFADDEPIVISNAGQALLRVRHTGDLFIVLAIVRAGSAHSASGVCHDPVLWHRRFGHLSHQGLARLQRLGLVTGLPVTAAQFLEQHKLRVVCEPCVLGQHRSRPFPPSKTRPSRPLSRLHSDLSGPLPVRALCGGQYLCTITDHFTGFGLVTALKHKSDAPAAIEDGIRLLENHAAAASSVQFLRSDNGGEYINARMQRICADRGIAHETSAPHTPQQNGLAERRNLTIMNCARSMLVESGLPQVFWYEAARYCNYLRNRSPVAGRVLTPLEALTGERPDVAHLRVFGCTAYVHVPGCQQSKLGPRSRKGRFIGIQPNSKAYRVFVDGKVVVSTNVIFDETPAAPPPPAQRATPFAQHLAPIVEEPALRPAADQPAIDPPAAPLVPPQPTPAQLPLTPAAPYPALSELAPTGAAVPCAADRVSQPAALPPLVLTEPEQTLPDDPSASMQSAPAQRNAARRQVKAPVLYDPSSYSALCQVSEQPGPLPAPPALSERPTTRLDVPLSIAAHGPDPMLALTAPARGDEPTTWDGAMSSLAAPEWSHACGQELTAMYQYDVFDEVPLPPGAKAIGSKWLFTTKRDEHGTIELYKARVVGKGYSQRPGIDFGETFAPALTLTALRCFLAIIAGHDLCCRQLDVRTAFLNGALEEEVYLEPPPGVRCADPRHVWRLKKALYGLRQASRAWYQTLKQTLADLGFVPSAADPCVFVKFDSDGRLVAAFYVDDCLAGARTELELDQLVVLIDSHFRVKDLGEPDTFLGMSVTRDRPARTLKLSQETYTRNLLLRFRMDAASPAAVPLPPGTKLTKEGEPLPAVNRYAELVGCLMYLACGTRPDIAFAVNSLTRFMLRPMAAHWKAAQHILRYLVGTVSTGITYGGPSSPGLDAGVQVYCDADHAADTTTFKSTSGIVCSLNGGAVCWSSKLQTTAAFSTCEAEYQACSAATKEALYLRHLLPDLGYNVSGPIVVHNDNQGALSLIANPQSTHRSRHVGLAHHISRERQARGEVDFVYCPSKQNIADCLTKPLAEPALSFCLKSMGVA